MKLANFKIMIKLLINFIQIVKVNDNLIILNI